MPFPIAGGNIAKLAYDKAEEAIETVQVAGEAAQQANEAAERANSASSMVEEKMEELEGVDAVQFHERQKQFDAQLAQKANEAEVRKETVTNPIKLDELHTEVKEAMTGGSVAVVGTNAVGNENIKDKAITTRNLNFYDVNNVYLSNGYVEVDYKSHKLTFRSTNASTLGQKISDGYLSVELVDGTRKQILFQVDSVTLANDNDTFVFDMDNNTTSVIQLSSLTKSHVILALRRYGGIVGGYLVTDRVKLANPREVGVLVRNGKIDINPSNYSVTFKPDTGLTMQFYTIKADGRFKSISFTTDTSYTLSTANLALVYNLHEDILEVVNFTTTDMGKYLVLLVRQDNSFTGGYLLERYNIEEDFKMLFFYSIGTLRVIRGTSNTITIRPQSFQYSIAGKGYLSRDFNSDITLSSDQVWALNMRTNTFEIVPFTTNLNKDYFVLAVNRYGILYGGELKKYIVNSESPLLPISNYKFTDFGAIPQIGSGFQSICWVGDELWVFKQSPDNHSATTGTIVRLNSEYGVIGTIAHSLGHCNSASYNERNDCLLIGNGSESYTDYAKFDLYPNVSSWKTLNTVDYFTIPRVEYDFSHTLEAKCQAAWGDSNFGEENVVYMVTNDNLIFRRLLLGKGANQFDNGNFLAGKASDEYNGTAKTLNTYYAQESFGLNGGSIFHNGKLYNHSSANRGNIAENTLCENGEVKVRRFVYPFYNETGSQVTLFPQGITVKNNKLFASFVDGKTGMVEFDLSL